VRKMARRAIDSKPERAFVAPQREHRMASIPPPPLGCHSGIEAKRVTDRTTDQGDMMKNRGVAAAAGLPEALPVDDFEPFDSVEVAIVREKRQLVLDAESRDPEVVQEMALAAPRHVRRECDLPASFRIVIGR
jgi:hypothetical protein